MYRHAELLADWLGEERGVTDFRKHVAWYLKGFSVGSELRRALALASGLAELAGLLASSTRASRFRPRCSASRAGAPPAPAGWRCRRAGWPTGSPARCRSGPNWPTPAADRRLRSRPASGTLSRMDLESGAGLLHRLTCYTPDQDWDVPVDDPRVRHDLVPNDLDTIPPPVKQYDAGLPVTPLPRELPDPGISATAVLAGARLRAGRSTRRSSAGSSTSARAWSGPERDWGQVLFRAAGSAGGRFPLEVYASTRECRRAGRGALVRRSAMPGALTPGRACPGAGRAGGGRPAR